MRALRLAILAELGLVDDHGAVSLAAAGAPLGLLVGQSVVRVLCAAVLAHLVVLKQDAAVDFGAGTAPEPLAVGRQAITCGLAAGAALARQADNLP